MCEGLRRRGGSQPSLGRVFFFSPSKKRQLRGDFSQISLHFELIEREDSLLSGVGYV